MMRISHIDEVLECSSVTTRFQPVFELASDHSATLYFCEALTSGPERSNLESAEVLFEYARRHGKEIPLDRLCIASAFRAFAGISPVVDLSLNVHASTLQGDEGFIDHLFAVADEYDQPLHGVVLEIVEHVPHGDLRGLRQRVERLKTSGVRVALDDVGAGQATFRMIMEIETDYLKVDRRLVGGCANDPRRGSILESLAQLAPKVGSRLIAEGIETTSDLDAVMSIGVGLGQGFLLGRPSRRADLEGILTYPVVES